MMHKTNVDTRLNAQRIEVREVGDVRQAHHRNVQRIAQRRPTAITRWHIHGVLGIEGESVDPGEYPQRRNTARITELCGAVEQQRRVAPQLVDDETLHPLAIVRREQHHGAVEGSKYTARVDVTHHNCGHIDFVGDTQIHDVMIEQVDLGR